MIAQGELGDSCQQVQDKVFKKCLDLIADREERYGAHWKTETVNSQNQNIDRKYRSFAYSVKNGKKIIDEDLLDIINYCAFRYIRLIEGE